MLKNKIPSILAIFALTIGLASGVYLIQSQQNFKLSASSSYTPKDIRISNITDDSFTVSWYTSKNASSYIDWGETPNLSQRAFPEDSNLNKIHYINVTDLRENKAYYFNINSGGENYDNSGVPWTVRTLLNSKDNSLILKGKVMLDEERPASGVLVYLQTDTSKLYSAMTTPNGTWAIPVSTDISSSILNIFVQGGSLGSASETMSAENPTKIIYLTNSNIFSGEESDNPFQLTPAEVVLPDTVKSRFNEEDN